MASLEPDILGHGRGPTPWWRWPVLAAGAVGGTALAAYLSLTSGDVGGPVATQRLESTLSATVQGYSSYVVAQRREFGFGFALTNTGTVPVTVVGISANPEGTKLLALGLSNGHDSLSANDPSASLPAWHAFELTGGESRTIILRYRVSNCELIGKEPFPLQVTTLTGKRRTTRAVMLPLVNGANAGTEAWQYSLGRQACGG